MEIDWEMRITPGAHPEHIGNCFHLTAYHSSLEWYPVDENNLTICRWDVKDFALYLGDNIFLVSGIRLRMYNDLHLNWHFYLKPAK